MVFKIFESSMEYIFLMLNYIYIALLAQKV